MRICLLVLASAVALTGGSAAQTQSETAIFKDALQWQEMIPGVAFASTHGDWEAGAHGKFVRIENDAVVPMHTHTAGYNAVVISGRMVNDYGNDRTLDLSPGDYFQIQAMQPHAHDCVTEEPCIFYTHSDEAWDIQVGE